MRKERGNQILAKRSAELLFSILSVVAEKNAKSLCRGFMHEPALPEKLKNR